MSEIEIVVHSLDGSKICLPKNIAQNQTAMAGKSREELVSVMEGVLQDIMSQMSVNMKDVPDAPPGPSESQGLYEHKNGPRETKIASPESLDKGTPQNAYSKLNPACRDFIVNDMVNQLHEKLSRVAPSPPEAKASADANTIVVRLPLSLEKIGRWGLLFKDESNDAVFQLESLSKTALKTDTLDIEQVPQGFLPYKDSKKCLSDHCSFLFQVDLQTPADALPQETKASLVEVKSAENSKITIFSWNIYDSISCPSGYALPRWESDKAEEYNATAEHERARITDIVAHATNAISEGPDIICFQETPNLHASQLEDEKLMLELSGGVTPERGEKITVLRAKYAAQKEIYDLLISKMQAAKYSVVVKENINNEHRSVLTFYKEDRGLKVVEDKAQTVNANKTIFQHSSGQNFGVLNAMKLYSPNPSEFEETDIPNQRSKDMPVVIVGDINRGVLSKDGLYELTNRIPPGQLSRRPGVFDYDSTDIGVVLYPKIAKPTVLKPTIYGVTGETVKKPDSIHGQDVPDLRHLCALENNFLQYLKDINASQGVEVVYSWNKQTHEFCYTFTSLVMDEFTPKLGVVDQSANDFLVLSNYRQDNVYDNPQRPIYTLPVKKIKDKDHAKYEEALKRINYSEKYFANIEEMAALRQEINAISSKISEDKRKLDAIGLPASVPELKRKRWALLGGGIGVSALGLLLFDVTPKFAGRSFAVGIFGAVLMAFLVEGLLIFIGASKLQGLVDAAESENPTLEFKRIKKNAAFATFCAGALYIGVTALFATNIIPGKEFILGGFAKPWGNFGCSFMLLTAACIALVLAAEQVYVKKEISIYKQEFMDPHIEIGASRGKNIAKRNQKVKRIDDILLETHNKLPRDLFAPPVVLQQEALNLKMGTNGKIARSNSRVTFHLPPPQQKNGHQKDEASVPLLGTKLK